MKKISTKRTKLENKAIEIAEIILDSQDKKMFRSEMVKILGNDLGEYYDVVKKSIAKLTKFKTCSIKKYGGIEHFKTKGAWEKLTNQDRIQLKSEIEIQFNKLIHRYNKNQPEQLIEESFKNWLKSKHPESIINFPSTSRKRKKWKNLDGYKIDTINSEYHLSFSPYVTAYEVKAKFPKNDDFLQAKSYLEDSNEVYLIFKGNDSPEKIKFKLGENSNSFVDDIGIYYTNDCKEFIRIRSAKINTPKQQNVDKMLDLVLPDSDREILIEKKQNYLKSIFVEMMKM